MIANVMATSETYNIVQQTRCDEHAKPSAKLHRIRTYPRCGTGEVVSQIAEANDMDPVRMLI